MVGTRSVVLERRPDLPLCSLRRMRQLRVDKHIGCGVRELLTSKSLEKAERDVCFLLGTPVKVSRSNVPRPDQIAVGKAIVDRPGKDDFWVTNDTAGWTFAAATREVPEGGPRPVSVERLRQVSERVYRSDETSRRGRLDGDRRAQSRQARAETISGLIGPRKLALLESRYRLAAAECRAETAGGLSAADPPLDRRFRRPKMTQERSLPNAEVAAACPRISVVKTKEKISPKNGRGVVWTDTGKGTEKAPDKTSSPASNEELSAEGGDGHRDETTATEQWRTTLSEDPDSQSVEREAVILIPTPAYDFDDVVSSSEEGGSGRCGGCAILERDEPVEHDNEDEVMTPRERLRSSRRLSPPHSRSKPPWSASRARTRPDSGQSLFQKTPHRARLQKGEFQGDFEDMGGINGGKMTPAPLCFGSDGPTVGHRGVRRASGKGGSMPHRGLVITDAVRAEILNPMSYRFKLLRRS